MKSEKHLIPTASQTVGPFFHLGCTDHRSVGCLTDANTAGERITLTCHLLDGDDRPVNDAMIEIWQADSAGHYDSEQSAQESGTASRFKGFGRLATDRDGTCAFKTIKPGATPGKNGTMQAPHISVSVFARGLLNRLCTRVYFAGEPANEKDHVLSFVPKGRRSTLLATRDTANASQWQFTIHLCGEYETVFFDV